MTENWRGSHNRENISTGLWKIANGGGEATWRWNVESAIAWRTDRGIQLWRRRICHEGSRRGALEMLVTNGELKTVVPFPAALGPLSHAHCFPHTTHTPPGPKCLFPPTQPLTHNRGSLYWNRTKPHMLALRNPSSQQASCHSCFCVVPTARSLGWPWDSVESGFWTEALRRLAASAFENFGAPCKPVRSPAGGILWRSLGKGKALRVQG